MPKVSRRGGISSVEHALHVLTLLGQRPSVGVSEVAAELDVAASSAHRLLATLQSHGFAVQDSRRRYCAGPAFAEVFQVRPTHETLRRLVRSHMVELARELGETVHVVVLEGPNVRFLDSVEADQALRVSSRAGRVLPAHCTSGGKALLAELSDAEVAALYPGGLPSWPAPAIATLEELHRHLETTRRRGYGTNIEESEHGIAAIGASLRGSSGETLGAVSASVPTIRLRREAMRGIADAVVRTARKASAAL
ncbi:MAG: IclR family transcriptional regulator [Streptosporangiaceae bacterium]